MYLEIINSKTIEEMQEVAQYEAYSMILELDKIVQISNHVFGSERKVILAIAQQKSKEFDAFVSKELDKARSLNKAPSKVSKMKRAA